MSEPIVHIDAHQKLKEFAAHALHIATLWQLGDLEMGQAVKQLRDHAERNDLIERFGRAEIEWIINAAFAEFNFTR